jgi:hypothetical protein
MLNLNNSVLERILSSFSLKRLFSGHLPDEQCS